MPDEATGAAEAIAALDQSWDDGGAPTAPEAPSAPAPGAASPADGQQATPPVGAVQDGGATAQDSFTQLDPNTLPPEVQPFYKSLQADYTRKMQEAAPYRQIGQELQLDPASVREAAEFYNRVRDPNNWGALYEQLGEAMSAYGYEFEQEGSFEPQPAFGPPQQFGQQPQTGVDLSQFENDPEFAPLVQHIRALEDRLNPVDELQARLDELEEFQTRQAEEQFQMALIGEVQRQEAAIRNANPHYTDEDIDAIYELSSYYNGELVPAMQAYERIVNNRLARFLAQKQGGAANIGIQPLPGGNAPTVATPEDDGISWSDRAKQALRLRGMEDDLSS